MAVVEDRPRQAPPASAPAETSRPATPEPPRRAIAPVVELPGAGRFEPFARGGVTLWALFGAAWVAFALSGWGRWIFSSTEFKAQPKGPDHFPSGDHAFAIGYQVFATGLLLTMLAIYLVRPLLRERRLSLDGMLLIGCSFAFFMDPIINLFHNDTFAWNAYVVNAGSWGSFIPGHVGTDHFGEGLLWAWPDYINFGVICPVLGCALFARLRRTRPSLSNVQAFTILFALLFIGTSLLEFLRVRLQLYSYARTWKALTLFPGKEYQWPLYEGALVAAGACVFTYVRWSWLTTGRSFVDAGIERLKLGPRGRTGVLLLAVIGFSAATWLCLWFIPWSWSSISAHSVAHLPSYMRPGP